MPTIRAQVPTTRATRYLAQLCSHTGHLSPGNVHGRSGHSAQSAPTSEATTETTGRISLGDAHCDLTADASALTLLATASDPEQLKRLKDAVSRTLERIGRRDRLAVTWEDFTP
jgi:hypothetical protein